MLAIRRHNITTIVFEDRVLFDLSEVHLLPRLEGKLHMLSKECSCDPLSYGMQTGTGESLVVFTHKGISKEVK